MKNGVANFCVDESPLVAIKKLKLYLVRFGIPITKSEKGKFLLGVSKTLSHAKTLNKHSCVLIVNLDMDWRLGIFSFVYYIPGRKKRCYGTLLGETNGDSKKHNETNYGPTYKRTGP